MLKDATSRGLGALGVDGFATAFCARKLLIVTYHGVVGALLDPPCPWHIEDALFREQMTWLARHRTVLPLDECVRRMHEGEELPDRPAVVTFDDGYRSVRTRALPVLQRLGIPATVFVVTGAIGSGQLLCHDSVYLALVLTKEKELDLRAEGGSCHRLASARLRSKALVEATRLLSSLRAVDQATVLAAIIGRLDVDLARWVESEDFALLSAGEITEMASGGLITFGSHGQCHTAMTLLPEAAARREVCASLARVRQLSGAEVIPFAYPYGRPGDLDATVADLLRAGGATCALTTVPGLNALDRDPFALRRIGVGAGLSTSRFRMRISGLSGWGLRLVGAFLLKHGARWRSSLRPLRRFWRKRLFHRESVVVFGRGPEKGDGRPVLTARGRYLHFGQASAGKLKSFADRLAPRDEAAFLARVDERFAARMCCFVIRRGTSIVASAWVSEASHALLDEVERSIDIGQDAVYIFDALTVPEWRGKGLFPHLLDRIARSHSDRTKVIAVSRRNKSSRRGIEKAGFTPLATYPFLKVVGVVICGRTAAQGAATLTS